MTKPKSFALTALSKVRCGMPSVNPDDNPAKATAYVGREKFGKTAKDKNRTQKEKTQMTLFCHCPNERHYPP